MDESSSGDLRDLMDQYAFGTVFSEGTTWGQVGNPVAIQEENRGKPCI